MHCWTCLHFIKCVRRKHNEIKIYLAIPYFPIKKGIHFRFKVTIHEQKIFLSLSQYSKLNFFSLIPINHICPNITQFSFSSKRLPQNSPIKRTWWSWGKILHSHSDLIQANVLTHCIYTSTLQ